MRPNRPTIQRVPSTSIRLMDLPTDEFTRQITLVDYEFYSAIQVSLPSPLSYPFTFPSSNHSAYSLPLATGVSGPRVDKEG